MDELASDESNDELLHLKTFSSKKRQLQSLSSSDDDNHATPAKAENGEENADQNPASRSSERIRKRKSRSFTMPTKEDIWHTITTTKSPEKTYSELKPRKLVNNFTRVTHRYNHDPAYTSDEGDSLDGFVVMEDDSDSSDTSDSDFYDETMVETDPRKKKKKHRILKRRIVQASSDSDSDSRETRTRVSAAERKDDCIRVKLREKLLNKRRSVDVNTDMNIEKTCSAEDKTDSGDENKDIPSVGGKRVHPVLISSSDDENNVKKRPVSKQSRNPRKRARRVKSDSRNRKPGERNDSSDADGIVSRSRPEKSAHESRDEKGENADDGISEGRESVSVCSGEDTVGQESSDNDSVQMVNRKRTSVLDSGSSESSEEDEDTGSLSRSALQSRSQKEKRASLFKDFKQARSKLESKNKPK